MTTILLTMLALLGFAGNSILCRMALAPGLIDPVSFTSVRIGAGALTLLLLTLGQRVAGTWLQSAMLVAYALLFSYAYGRIGAAVGALVLFGAVQVTMLGRSMHQGDGLRWTEVLGVIVALGGLVVLAVPGLSAPDVLGLSLMAASGIAWGVYSLCGKGVTQPLLATAGNFVRGTPMVAVASLATMTTAHATTSGLILAAMSGAITSGIGYCIWYAVLPRVTTARAALAQLTVPVIAAAGAVLLLGEPVTARLLVTGALIVGGVCVALYPQRR